jgi:uncharacterized protein YyaL (SSP411 family)
MIRIYTLLLAVCSIPGIAQSAMAQQQAPMSSGYNRSPHKKIYEEYLRRAEYLYHKVWSLYRVPQYGMFSEYYPQQHRDTLTYMQDQQVQSKKVSFLWPFSGVFSATNILLQVPGKHRKYLPYLDSVAMAMEQYRDTSRKPAGYQAYPPMFEKSDRYYDDNGLVALDYTWAYRNTGNPVFLHRAEETFRFILSGWSGKLGGGVTWLEGHDDQKPACSNGMATLSSLKLYEVTKDSHYLNWGLRFYDWMYHNLRDTSGLYSNDKKTADSSVNHTYWTYNSGAMIEAAVMLYRFTGKKAYLKEAQTTAEATCRHFGKAGKNGKVSILDMPWFVLVLFRGYEALYLEDRNPKYITIIKQNADEAWLHARDRFGLIYKNWNGNTDESGTAKWLLDESCMAEFYIRFALLQLK